MVILTLSEIGEKTGEDLAQDVDYLTAYFQDKLPELLAFATKVLIALVVFVIGSFLIRRVTKLVIKSLKKSPADEGVAQFVGSLVKASLYIALLLILVMNLGVEGTSIAALLASGGVAIGLALQGSLSNLAGGVLILLLKPFVVGDYIIEDNKGNEGTVKEIHVFYTKLSTVDNKTVILPNGSLANTSLTNVTDRDYRQLDLKFYIAYHADLQKAKQVITEVLAAHPDILDKELTQVFVSELGEHAVVMGLRAWTKTDQYMRVRWDVLEQIKLKMDQAEVEMCPATFVKLEN